MFSARAMEPPPLVYEIIEKKLKALGVAPPGD